MKVLKKSSFVAILITLFSVMSFLVLNNQTKIKASDKGGSSYVLEKKSETKNQVEFDLKVKDPQKSTITLSLDNSDQRILYAENIMDYLPEKVANKLEITDDDTENQVTINFKETLGSNTLPIIFKASEYNKTISNTLKVISDEKVVSKASFDLDYQKEVIETPVVVKDDVKEQARGFRSAVSVNNWDTFKAALANTAVDVINVDADITRTATNAASAPGTLSRNLTINGNNHKIDFGANNGNVTLGATSVNKLVVNDAMITKQGATSIFNSSSASAIWDVTFNNVSTPENNVSGVIEATNSTLRLAGENNFYATNNTVTILHVYSSDGAKSKITTNQSSNTLTVWAVGINDGNRGGGTINLDNATLVAHSTGSSAIRLRYGGNKFNVTNRSKLTAITDTTGGDAATVRFSTNNPNNEFNISDNSEIDIQHLAGEAPALRLNGDGFITNVSGKSKLNLYNKGSGSASNNSNEALNLPGSNNTFTIRDKDSQVNMIANYGPAVYGNSNTSTIDAGPDTEFIARGNTSGEAYGVFNMGANASVLIDNPIYYDFANTRSGGANIFSLSGAGGKFVANNTDVSVWKKGKNVYVDDPLYDWTLIDFTLTGSNLATIASTSDTGFKSLFGQPNNYARMSGNNARPIVDDLRIPTNADKAIYGHVSVPEGVEGIRDAWTDEVEVDVTVKNADGSIAYTLTDDTIGSPGLSLWGETAKNGLFKINLPNGKFLETGQTIEVTGARRRGANSQSGKMHESLPEDIQTTIQTVIDVTPPTQTAVSNTLNNATKQLSGTSDEDGAKVFVKVNGEWLKGVDGKAVSTTVDVGKWTLNLSRYLDKSDKVDVYLKDKTIISPIPTYTLPKTYTQEPDGVFGNLNVEVDGYDGAGGYSGYHDAVKSGTDDNRFESANRLIVEDGIPDMPLMEKTVISSSGKSTQVGDILTYTLKATNGKKATLDAVWNKVTVKDTIPEGLTFDPATAAVTINGMVATASDFTYDAATRLLTVNVGNLKAGVSATVTFKTEVQQSAVGKVINNVGTATGFSPRESGEFIEGPDDPNRAHEVFSKNANVDNPGGSIFGILELVSAPKTINFGTTKFSPKGTKINNPSYEGGDLVVKDSRAVQETWTLNARLEKELAKVDDPSTYIPRAIRYVHQNDEITLMGASQPIISRKNANSDSYNISGTWSPEGDGFKLKVESGQSVDAGKYEATIVWELVAGPPSANP
ncbi:isopeptide-forming domain-containing fimbrial protein [Candidatus Enterococcus ikei]|uniref:Isopeptide-forming domain-containing fimbrial protein n=1 Tax=Candidatus Enterococcus ikei TaxID=2815326 RepID=A0ABS3H0S7_9ENTE|nr:isopeptide-forming domain-containing fimbrial protein [Enterococcus sp. DIV0869a]MBO0441108.1 isopeptide-forming domain-containing fimbrial protein [Enterococcus sp. DIV0869a]